VVLVGAHKALPEQVVLEEQEGSFSYLGSDLLLVGYEKKCALQSWSMNERKEYDCYLLIDP
jgi:hypothetical protein